MSDHPFADSLSVVSSDTGCIHIRLLDEDGKVIAVAAVTPTLSISVVNAIETIRRRIEEQPALANLAPAGSA